MCRVGRDVKPYTLTHLYLVCVFVCVRVFVCAWYFASMYWCRVAAKLSVFSFVVIVVITDVNWSYTELALCGISAGIFRYFLTTGALPCLITFCSRYIKPYTLRHWSGQFRWGQIDIMNLVTATDVAANSRHWLPQRPGVILATCDTMSRNPCSVQILLNTALSWPFSDFVRILIFTLQLSYQTYVEGVKTISEIGISNPVT